MNFQHPMQVRLVNPQGVLVNTRISLLNLTPEGKELPRELADDLYALTRNQRSLIFCNARDGVEKLTHTLNRRCSRDQLNERYLPHHSSISKELREEAERRMQEEDRPSSVVCTSTLELGIDIGQLDLVVQINSTASVSSFAQRIGRSGRRLGNTRTMQVYSTDETPQTGTPFYEAIPYLLLQALAVIELFLEKWVEPPSIGRLAYNVLYQQIMSYLAQRNGVTPNTLVSFFMQSGVFPDVTADDYELLLRHFASISHIEQLADGKLIVGLAGEKILNSRDFYAVFQSPPDWTVLHGTKNLGMVAPSPDLCVGGNLILSGHTWEIIEILPPLKQVLVKAAGDAERTYFSSSGSYEVHSRVGQKILALLQSDALPSYLSDNSKIILTEARKLAQSVGIDRKLVFEVENKLIIFHWTGTRTARALVQLLKQFGLNASLCKCSKWIIQIDSPLTLSEFADYLAQLSHPPYTEQDLSEVDEEILRSHKFDEYLPTALLRKRAAKEYFNFEEARKVMASIAHSLS